VAQHRHRMPGSCQVRAVDRADHAGPGNQYLYGSSLRYIGY
jgi:hypothetical protein